MFWNTVVINLTSDDSDLKLFNTALVIKTKLNDKY